MDYMVRLPIYLKLAGKIKNQILRGEYPPGTKLPSIRALSRKMNINPNTIQRTFSILKDEHLIEKRLTHQGYFITTDSEISKIRKSTTDSIIAQLTLALNEIGYTSETIQDLFKNRQLI